MTLAEKLQLRTGQGIAVLHAPPDLALDLSDAESDPRAAASADAVLVFVGDSADLAERSDAFVAAARRDALAWIAYPKAGQLGTDLGRDSLARTLEGSAIRPVRQISIDDVWSALRFRPA